MRGLAAAVLLVACVPVAQRTDTVSTTTAVEAIDVSVEPESNVGWTISVANHRATAIRLVWDESSYVMTSGQSAGRLIRGKTRRMHAAQPQPDTPIAPSATLTEWCVPEEHVAWVGRVDGPQAEAGASGRLLLVFDTDDGKVTWEGAVTFGERP